MGRIKVFDKGDDVLLVQLWQNEPVLDQDGQPTGELKPKLVKEGLGWLSAMERHFDTAPDGSRTGPVRKMTAAEKKAYMRSLIGLKPDPASVMEFDE